MRRRACLLLLVLGLALLTARAGADQPPEGMFVPLKPGEPLPCMELRDRAGNVHDVSRAEEGGRPAPGPVVLLFWSAFCPNCLEVIPEVARFAETNNLCFWAVNVDGEQFSNAVDAYLKNNKLDLPTVYDRLEGEYLVAADPLGVSKTPTLYLADARGRVVLHQVVEIDLDAARTALARDDER